MNPIQRIGVLTGGGDAPGLNAVIRAVVKTAILSYNWEVYGIHDGYEGLLREQERTVRPLDLASVRGILPRGGTILGAASHSNEQFLRLDGRTGQAVVTDWALTHIPQRMTTLGLDALVIIGGDGTMTIGGQLAQVGVRLVGVPKTIDNDLPATEVTFGFDTALDTATEALDKLHTTAESHHRVMILEVMGRNAGWIALHAGVAGGADVILIPEIPFSIPEVCRTIAERRESGRRFSIIVVAEGASPVGGAQVYRQSGSLGGIGEWVAREVSQHCATDARTVVLGHLQRGGSPSAFDRILATQYGAMAVRLLAEGRFQQVVALRCGEVVGVPLSEAIGHQRKVALDSSIMQTARHIGVNFGAPPPRG